MATNNKYLNIYIDYLIKTFRSYNDDCFTITIFNLKKFINGNDKDLEFLFEQLRIYNFNIELKGSNESVKQVDVNCINITDDTSYNFSYQIQNVSSIIELSSKTNISVPGVIIMKIVAQIINKFKLLYKVIVLDLDDTLWKGTLSETGIQRIKDNMLSDEGSTFVSFMSFIKVLANELGIFIAICSRNKLEEVKSAIEYLDDTIFPLKNNIDCIVANNNDKSENIRYIAEQLSVLPNSIIFIDDNHIVRDEVKNKMQDIFVPEWTNHYDLITQLIIGCFFERIELSYNSQNKRKQYQIIRVERASNSLPILLIKANMDDEHKEANKLYIKTNQFKFSQNNITNQDMKSLYFEIYRENGENLGICSAITYITNVDSVIVHNWAISCRYFQIGLEEFILIYIKTIVGNKQIFISYQPSDYNQKVDELLNKYPKIFKKDSENKIKLCFTEDTMETLFKNTNLRPYE